MLSYIDNYLFTKLKAKVGFFYPNIRLTMILKDNLKYRPILSESFLFL